MSKLAGVTLPPFNLVRLKKPESLEVVHAGLIAWKSPKLSRSCVNRRLTVLASWFWTDVTADVLCHYAANLWNIHSQMVTLQGKKLSWVTFMNEVLKMHQIVFTNNRKTKLGEDDDDEDGGEDDGPRKRQRCVANHCFAAYGGIPVPFDEHSANAFIVPDYGSSAQCARAEEEYSADDYASIFGTGVCDSVAAAGLVNENDVFDLGLYPAESELEAGAGAAAAEPAASLMLFDAAVSVERVVPQLSMVASAAAVGVERVVPQLSVVANAAAVGVERVVTQLSVVVNTAAIGVERVAPMTQLSVVVNTAIAEVAQTTRQTAVNAAMCKNLCTVLPRLRVKKLKAAVARIVASARLPVKSKLVSFIASAIALSCSREFLRRGGVCVPCPRDRDCEEMFREDWLALLKGFQRVEVLHAIVEACVSVFGNSVPMDFATVWEKQPAHCVALACMLCQNTHCMKKSLLERFLVPQKSEDCCTSEHCMHCVSDFILT